MKLSEELKWRGFVNQTTYKDIKALDGKPVTFYFGVDPSADSMTIGNLAAAMMNRVFIKHGHKAYLLVGGATGMIGDPDGKATERELLTLEQLDKNKKAIEKQYKQVFGGMHFKLVDNYDWFRDIGYLEFLREIGKNVPMRAMLGRDFVQSRLSKDGAGISYAELSYMLIQGYDFLHLYRKHKVTLQLCGADQWGNSIAGVDLIRRIKGGEAHVWSTPLVINKATGKKFGKTEEGAVWLDGTKTSVYKFYQFWLNLDDEGVEDYIKIYTDLDKKAVDKVMREHHEERGKRVAQKRLAYEATAIVHGAQAAKSQVKIAEALFSSKEALRLDTKELASLAKEFPVAKVPRQLDLSDLEKALVDANLASSRTEARRFITSGAVYINNVKITETSQPVIAPKVRYAVLRRGKNTNAMLQVV